MQDITETEALRTSDVAAEGKQAIKEQRHRAFCVASLTLEAATNTPSLPSEAYKQPTYCGRYV